MEVTMKKSILSKFFIYLLCFSFLLLTSGFPRMTAEATESGLPIGEMISSGQVKFEARQNVWKKVEPIHFPVFQRVRIKTEKGLGFIVLAKNSQIEVGQNSLFSFQDEDQFHLLKGGVSFRIPSGAEMSFRVANLSIAKSLPLQAAKSPLVSPRSEETVGSIALHPNGAVTVKSIRGPLSIQNQDRVVLAALSSNESVTIPSAAASGEQRQMVAQVGEYPTGEALTEEVLGLSNTTWMIIGLATVVVAGVGIALAVSDDDDHDFVIPTSP
jgi:hypothetical protein